VQLCHNMDALVDKMRDRAWRLNNLYQIKDAAGRAVPFKLNWAQQDFYENLHYFNIILKARQLGFSTFIIIYMLDSCIFNDNQNCGVIADTLDNAQDLLDSKARFAYDNLSPYIKEQCTLITDSAQTIEFANGSRIRVGVSLRGGTYQKLHISEYGKIAARQPDKAAEIKTGALNTVHAGQQIFVESTAEGQQGEFFELTRLAQSLQESNKELSPLDPKFHFYPWYHCPTYLLSGDDAVNTSIPAELQGYFSDLRDKHSVELSFPQKAWYAKKLSIMGDLMKREFPTTPEEAFEVSLEGAYYTKQMGIVRRNGQIRKVPHDASRVVHTFWDLGISDSMSIWFFQHVGFEYRFIRYFEASGEGIEFYANHLKSLGYMYGNHYWPHDGATRDLSTGKERKQTAQEFGIRPITIVPRAVKVQDEIELVRQILPRCWFDEENCAAGIKHLDNYRKEWDDKMGMWKEKPRHDAASHGSDAFRTFAKGYKTDDHALFAPNALHSPEVFYPALRDQAQFAQSEYDMFGG